MPKKLIISSILITIILFSSCKVWALGPITPPPYQQQPPGGGETREECVLATCAWWDIGCIATYLLTLPLRVIALIIGAIGLGIGLILVWVGFGVVPGIVDTVIKTSLELDYMRIVKGWGIVGDIQGIALSLIYLFLVIVGLATILKFLFPFAEYEAKKVLAPLIVFALLINFAPTITAKIIQWGNDITKAFKATLAHEAGEGEDFLNSKSIGEGLRNALVPGATDLLGRIFCINGHFERYFEEHEGKGPVIPMIILFAAYPWIVASIGVFILTSFISFGILFLMRTIFFIALTIVSPIAFLTAAFRTKEMRAIFPGFLNWEEWSQTLLQWAFIGVMLVIWLGIAGKIAKEGGDILIGSIEQSPGDLGAVQGTTLDQLEPQMKTEFARLLKYLIPPLGAAAAIFFASISTPKLGQQFAGAAFGFLRQVGNALMVGAAVAVGAFAGAAAGAAASGIKSIREAKGIGGKLKALGKTAITVPARGFGALAKEGAVGGLRAALAPIPAEMRKEMVAAWTRRVSAEEAKKYVKNVEKDEGPKGVQNVVENKFKIHSDLERMEGIKMAIEGGYYKEEWAKDEGIKRLTLRVYEEAAKKRDKKLMETMERRLVVSFGEEFEKIAEKEGLFTKEDKEKFKTYTNKIIASVKTIEEMKELQKGWLEKAAEGMDVLVEHLRRPQLALMGRVREFTEIYSKYIENFVGKIGPDEFIRRYPAQAMFLTGTAAQELGYRAPFGLTRERIRELRRIWEEEERRKREEEERIRIGMRRMFGR
jgi:hypothetical protein